MYLYITLSTYPYINAVKKNIYKNTYIDKSKKIDSLLILPVIFNNISDKFNKFCTFNPISPQGMLIFGLLTSVYRLYPINYNDIINFKTKSKNK